MRVAEAAASALGDEHALARPWSDRRTASSSIGLLGIAHEDERADRHRDLEVVRRRGRTCSAPWPPPPRWRREFGSEAEVDERVAVRIARPGRPSRPCRRCRRRARRAERTSRGGSSARRCRRGRPRRGCRLRQRTCQAQRTWDRAVRSRMQAPARDHAHRCGDTLSWLN